MENKLLNRSHLTAFIFLLLVQTPSLFSQCPNVNFENGNLTGWTGTYGDGTCTGTMVNGQCSACYTPDPLQHATLHQGPNNHPANGQAGANHFIMTSGFDPVIGGNILPVVYTPGSYSFRLGDAHANDAGHGGGETIKYRFTVTPNNCNFTYHYAVVLKDGGHSNGQQPYFKIGMLDGNNNPIDCATYDVDATTAQTIGGFVSVGPLLYKNWTTVFIPLNNYIGQTVSIQFTTRDCAPNGCEGSHYAYAYIDADCNTLQIGATSPTICNGQTVVLTAPDGAASYSWSGPGIVSGANTQQCTINAAGNYTVNMMTLGTVPCNFTMSTLIPVSPNSLVANFTTGTACAGSPVTFTDISSPAGSATTWAWDFNNDGTTDANTQNPSHTFAAAGSYPVRLRIGSPPCIDDTVINVVVAALPTSSFTSTSPVCEGADATITYTGSAPFNATYNWNFAGGTVTSGSGQGPYTISWSSAGIKNISLTTSSNGCPSPSTTVPVTVHAVPVVSVSPDIAICEGTNTTLHASGASTYSWSPSTGLGSSSGTNVTATPVSTITYQVTGTTSGCTDSASVTVSIKPLPTSSFTATSPVCAGANASINYTGSASATATYNWNFNGGNIQSGSGAGPYEVSWPTGGIKNVSLTTTFNGCTSALTTVPVTVNALPIVSVSPNTAICAGASTALTASGAGSYVWTPANGLSSTSGSSVTANPLATTTYAVTGTMLGCTDSASVTVTIKPLPIVSVSPDAAICLGESTTLTATGATTYNWSPGNGLSATNTASVTATPVATSSYSVTGTSQGCTDSASVTVSIKPNPISTFAATSPVCEGANASVSFSGTNSASTTYNWNFAGGTVLSGTGQGPYQVNWNTAGVKNITLTTVLNGCSSPITTVPVTVNALPVVTISPVAAICAGESTTLYATGATSYSWSPAAGLISQTGSSVIASPATTTTYQVTGTSLGCTDSATVTVSIKPNPVSSFTATSPVCAGAAAAVTYTGTNLPNTIYNWNFAGGTVLSGTAQGPYQINWNTAGVKNLSLITTLNGCSSPLTNVPVTVNPLPVVSVSPDAAICAGESTQLTASGADTYAWSPAQSLSSAAGASVSASPMNNTSYMVTGNTAGCTGTATVSVQVTPVPIASFSPVTGQCLENNHFLFSAGGTYLQGATFHWDFGPNGLPLTSAVSNQLVSFAQAGSQAISLTITQNGCVSEVFTDTTQVYAMPVASFTADTILGCENLPVCFTDHSVSDESLIYQWSFGDGYTANSQNPCHTYASAGNYTVSLQTTSTHGCSDQWTVHDMITTIENPIASFSLSNPVIQLPATTVNLLNHSQQAVSYLWLLNENLSSSAENPGIVSFTNPGYYPITLYAYNQLGCVDSTQLGVTVYQEESLFVPNVFTPNGDGNNDFFEIFGKKDGWKQIEVQVFDRWGEKVFESNDHNFKWDGTYRGENMMNAVFVYTLRIVYTNNHADQMHKGSLTLVR